MGANYTLTTFEQQASAHLFAQVGPGPINSFQGGGGFLTPEGLFRSNFIQSLHLGGIHKGRPHEGRGGQPKADTYGMRGVTGQRQMRTSAKCVVFELNFKIVYLYCPTQLINKLFAKNSVYYKHSKHAIETLRKLLVILDQS